MKIEIVLVEEEVGQLEKINCINLQISVKNLVDEISMKISNFSFYSASLARFLRIMN